MKKIAFVFPGQGSQCSGMGRDIYEKYDIARDVFEKFDEIAEKSISKLCFEGNEDELRQTVNSQPAILAVSLALYEILAEKADLIPDFVAGHSLGEYAALYSAGVMSMDELIKLVLKRAELMNNAPQGAMTAILGLDESKISELVEQISSEGIVCAANYNTQVQTVISGEINAITRANELAKTMGAKRVVPLAVSGGFHSPLMRPVSEKFAKYVNDTNVNDSEIPVITNVDAKSTIDKAEFSSKMIMQMYSPVYWRQSVEYMLEQGVDTFFEVGPGTVLSGMIRKISPKVTVRNIYDVESIEKIMEEEFINV